MAATIFYGQYLYCKYSGDWDMATEHWKKIISLLRIMEVVNDWAVPCTSAREAARYSAIDMDTISYLGMCALERMAEQLNDKTSRARVAYLRAKTGWSVFLRLNFRDWVDPERRHPEILVLGFHEESPDVRYLPVPEKIQEDIYTIAATLFCWGGNQPELYQTLTEVFPERS